MQTARNPARVCSAVEWSSFKTVPNWADRGPSESQSHRDPAGEEPLLEIGKLGRLLDDCPGRKALAMRIDGTITRFGGRLRGLEGTVIRLRIPAACILPAACITLDRARIATALVLAGGHGSTGSPTPDHLAEDGIGQNQHNQQRCQNVPEHACYLVKKYRPARCYGQCKGTWGLGFGASVAWPPRRWYNLGRSRRCSPRRQHL